MQETAQDFSLIPAVPLTERIAPFPSDNSGMLRVVAAVSLVLVYAWGTFGQIQVLLFQGRVPITPAIFKIILLAILAIIFVARGGRFVLSSQVTLGLLLLLGLLVQTGHLLFSTSSPLSDLLISNFLGYFMPLIACAFAAVPMMIEPKLLTRLLFVVFVVSLGIGTAQFLLNQTILTTESADGNFSVQAWNFYGRVRAFGLFASPLLFGLFCCLIANFGVMLAVRKRRRLVGWAVTVLAGLGCYATLTRDALLCFAIGIVASLVVATGKPRFLVRLLPVLALALSLLVFGFGLSRLGEFNRGQITSSETFAIRLSEWTYYLDMYWHLPLTDRLVGSGLGESLSPGRVKHLANEGAMLLDNTYIALLLNVGVMGLVLFVGLYVAAWNAFSRKVAQGASTLMLATVATFATFPFVAGYVVILNEIGILMLLGSVLAF